VLEIHKIKKHNTNTIQNIKPRTFLVVKEKLGNVGVTHFLKTLGALGLLHPGHFPKILESIPTLPNF
jgi:hypothetical protein